MIAHRNSQDAETPPQGRVKTYTVFQSEGRAPVDQFKFPCDFGASSPCRFGAGIRDASAGRRASCVQPWGKCPYPAPQGWQIVTLRGGPFARHRLTVPLTEDRLVLFEDATEHQYFRTNNKPELTHQSLINGAFGQGGAK